MPGRTSKAPGTSHHALYIRDSLAGPAWKHSRPGPPVLGVTPGHQPSNHPGTGVPWGCRACCSVTAGCGMVLTLGGCQCLSIPWMCLWMGSGSSFGQAGKPQAAGKGSTGLAASYPHLSWGDTQSPPHPAPLCLSGQDSGLSRSPPQFGSIYHVRGNGTPQPLWWGGAEDVQLWVGPGCPSAKLGQVPTAKCLFPTHGGTVLVSCGSADSGGGAQGGMSGC